jgi:phage-related minor tail protein
MEGRQLLVRFGAELGPLEKAIVAATRQVQAFGKEIVGVGKALSAAITVPLAGLGVASIAASEALAGAMNTIRLGTGATGADLESLGKTMRTVYGELPVTAAQAGTAIADLNTRAGLTGAGLDAMARQMLNLSKVAGVDVGQAITSTQKAFNSWGVAARDQGAALDLLWKTSQATGIGVLELAEKLALGGASLRAIGVPLATATIMLGGFERAGLSTEVVMAGLRMGATKLAMAGQDMGSGMARAFGQIKSAPSDAAAATIAITAFGESGMMMASAIRRGAFDVDALTASLAASTETVNQAAEDTRTLGERFSVLQNRVNLALEPLGKALVDVLLQMMPLLTGAVNVLAALVGAFGRLPVPVQSAIVVMGGLAAAIGPAVIVLGGLIIGAGKVSVAILSLKATAGPALATVAALFTSGGVTIAGIWGSVVGVFASIAGVLAPAIAGVIAAGAAFVAFATSPVTLAVAAMALVAVKWDWLREKLLAIAEAIPGAIAAMWADLKGLVRGAAGIMMSSVRALGSTLASAARVALGPFYDSIISVMTSVEDYVAKAWARLKPRMTKMAAWIQEKVQGLLDGMGGIVGKIVDLASRAGKAVAKLMRPKSEDEPKDDVPPISTPGNVTLGDWSTSGKLLGAQGPSRDWLYKQQAAAAGSASGAKVTTAFPSPPGFLSQPVFRRMAGGGVVDRPGGMLALIGEAGPEAVVPLSRGRGGRGDVIVNVHVTGSVATQADLAEQVRRSLIRLGQRNGTTGLV